MKTKRKIGIVGYGAYIPAYRLPTKKISDVWLENDENASQLIKEKSVAHKDEDTVTMSIEAAKNALARADILPDQLRAVWVGSESHPYAVKPTGTIVAQALGVSNGTLSGDFEFACKAGTEAMQAAFGFVGSSMGEYALAIGMDTAQAKPGDQLEYTASSGGAAYIIGPAEDAIAELEGSYSFVSDTPDFFRREHQIYPEHSNRFTGHPAYFYHITNSVTNLLDELGAKSSDYRYAVFHQPNIKFPQRLAKKLGFTHEQIRHGLLVEHVGNTYAGSSPLGLTNILDRAEPGDKILLASFGSGAGSDAMSFQVTDKIRGIADKAPLTKQYVERRIEIDYATYVRWRNKILR